MRLAELFAGACPIAVAADAPLEVALAALVERALAERGGLALDPAALVRFVAAGVRDGANPLGTIAVVHAGDVALAVACLRGDRAALAAFDVELVATASAALRAARASDAEIDEVTQLVRARLLVAEPGRAPRLGEYSGRGELSRWVKAVVVRTFLNLVRSRRRDVLVDDDQVFDELASPGLDPELAYLKQRYRAELRAAFLEALGGLSDTLRNVLRYRYLDDLTVEEIGRLHRVHRATVHRWLNEARAALGQETEALLRRRLSLSEAELDSLSRLVGSQLDWSLTQAFAEP